ncbi:MAG TPA: SBBP repeat-containing protein [Bryobacteraceae bacterium]|nr:SBBP repeat-containing protein [Bryobacteraceae bacterium]
MKSLFVALLVVVALRAQPLAAQTPKLPVLEHSDTIGRRTAAFLPNRGQAPKDVLWEAKGAGFEAWFRADSFVLRTFRIPRTDARITPQSASPVSAGVLLGGPAADAPVDVDEQTVTLLGGTTRPLIEPLNAQPAKVSFFWGNDPQRWAQGLTTYSRLRYKNVYPGIDLLFYGSQNRLEYDFVVSPGGNPDRIRMRVDGARAHVNEHGELVVSGRHETSLHRPVLYQNIDRGKRLVEGRFFSAGKSTVGFRFSGYDKGRPLVIDPAINLLYSTYAGGLHNDEAWDMVLDTKGNIYLTGYSASQDFPVTANAVQTRRGAIGTYTYNVVVMKFNSAGTLLYSTFLGGSGTALGQSIVLNSDGSIYVAGYTQGADFPVTSNAFQHTFGGGGRDGFLAKLSPDGSQLLYSTFLGGTADESISKLLLNSDGSLWMAGGASGPGLPASANAFQRSPNGTDNLYVAKAQFNSSGVLQLPYLTFLGGSSQGQENYLYVDLTSDPAGNVYLGAATNSADFPVTANAYERPFPLSGGCRNSPTPNSVGILTKFSPDLSQMLYSTVIGGHVEAQNGFPDCNQGVLTVHLDPQGNIWMVGTTGTSDFPVSANAISKQLSGSGTAGVDNFVAELSADGSRLIYGTYLGGTLFDYGGHGVWDASGNIWIVGTSQSTDFPVTANALQPRNAGGYDVTLTELSPDGATMLYSTYFGGSGDDNIEGQGRIRLDAAGNIYLASETNSPNFPVTPTAAQSTFAEGDANADLYDIFLTVLGSGTLGTISPVSVGNAGDATITVTGAGFQSGGTCSLVMGGTTIQASTVHVSANGTSMTCTFSLSGATAGNYDVVVANGAGGSVTKSSALVVQPGLGPQVSVDIVGRPAIRVNTPTTFTLTVSNTGDANAYGVLINVAYPSTATVTFNYATLPPLPGGRTISYSGVSPTITQGGTTNQILFLPFVPAGSVTPYSFTLIDSTLNDPVSLSASAAYSSASLSDASSNLSAAFASSPRTNASSGGPNALACFNDIVGVLGNAFGVPGCIGASTVRVLIGASLGGFDGSLPNPMYNGSGFAWWLAQNIVPNCLGLVPGVGQAAGAALNAWLALGDCGGQKYQKAILKFVTQGAIDPNEKSGSMGDASTNHYVTPAKPISYSIGFENQPTATLPAAQVVVTDQLDTSKLDLNTVTLGAISFGNTTINLPSGTNSYSSTVSISSSLSVRIQGSLNPTTGLLKWTFTSIDPSTGLPPSDPTVGFLPPDTDGVKGQGTVIFSVIPKSGLATGTQISNMAIVVFDANAPINTPTWTNTIDATPPVSSVQALPSSESQAAFTVSWSGSDVGSGIASYKVYFSDNGGPFTLWQSGVTATSATFTGQPGHTYGFYSIATDSAGNVQPAKTFADATTTISSTASPFGLSSLSTNVGAGGGMGTVTVTAPSAGAAWTATSNNPDWITVTAGATGTGNGTVSYSVAPNYNISRVGSITIAGLTFTINQGGTFSTNGLAFYPLTPCRIMDTRAGSGKSGSFGPPQLAARSSRAIPVLSSSCASGIPANAQAYALNITVVPPAPLTYLTIWPTGQAQPFVSTLNSFDGAVVANAAIVPPGSNGQISVFVSDASDVIIDINGYFAPLGSPGALAFYPAPPCRVADTRSPAGPFGGPGMTGGQTRGFTIPNSSCNIPSSAQAYSLNMTVVPPGPLTYLSAWPAGQNQPVVSTLNSFDGRVVANAAIVPAGTGGAIDVYVSNPSDVIIDINGYFAPAGGQGALYFYAASPCRVADTRGNGFSGQFGSPLLAGQSTRPFVIPASSCAIPSAAQAYSVNMTVVPQGPLNYLTTWPAGVTQPLVSTLNSFLGKVVANAAIVPAGTNGAINVFVTNPTDLIIDVNGYFAP